MSLVVQLRMYRAWREAATNNWQVLELLSWQLQVHMVRQSVRQGTESSCGLVIVPYTLAS